MALTWLCSLHSSPRFPCFGDEDPRRFRGAPAASARPVLLLGPWRKHAARPPFLPSSEITQRAVFHEIILKTLTARSDSLPSTPLLYSYPKHFSCKWFTSLHLAGKEDMQTQVPELSIPAAAPPPTARPPSSCGGTRPSRSVPGPPDCPGRAPAVREGRSGLTTLTRLFRSRPDLHALGSCSPVSSQPFRFQRWRGTIPV